jgi:hypothetical protein
MHTKPHAPNHEANDGAVAQKTLRGAAKELQRPTKWAVWRGTENVSKPIDAYANDILASATDACTLLWSSGGCVQGVHSSLVGDTVKASGQDPPCRASLLLVEGGFHSQHQTGCNTMPFAPAR